MLNILNMLLKHFLVMSSVFINGSISTQFHVIVYIAVKAITLTTCNICILWKTPVYVVILRVHCLSFLV